MARSRPRVPAGDQRQSGQPSLRKAVAASLPHAKVLRGLKKLGVSSPKRR
ncbi:phthiodiolone/phenolphthiodiolone dimycocerosates ketoreductase domain protein [Mycobacterium kansasii]|uniref:Phthiodiolone/phenolphthiodiolone dimycocerosates ketoreductase domain protein n=1 Tax=Mycobacterium kansasii TaxID=1768 RepID=A0A1V3XSL2_MYCKA|nr:phthiodiolone/phenolphthiodiolone dimycocerosates ketoreductase domain protein [Mycobacterium kansasii]